MGNKKTFTFESANDVKRYIHSILVRVENETLEMKKGQALTKIAYCILQCLQEERKQQEVETMRNLTEQLNRIERGI